MPCLAWNSAIVEGDLTLLSYPYFPSAGVMGRCKLSHLCCECWGSSLGLCVRYTCTLCYSPASLIFTKPFQNFSYLGLLLAQQEKYNVVKG